MLKITLFCKSVSAEINSKIQLKLLLYDSHHTDVRPSQQALLFGQNICSPQIA